MRGERALLRRMVRNLIDNARRHGSDAAPDVTVAQGRPATRGSTVRDHGPGVPEGERERIFEPFYRLAGSAETGRGSGLGLALVRQIARHHGGDVRCAAAPGGGSVFEIALPLDQPSAGRPAPAYPATAVEYASIRRRRPCPMIGHGCVIGRSSKR